MCWCQYNYIGDPTPIQGCKLECLTDPDCGDENACRDNRCMNPCSGYCRSGEDCRVSNHRPVCSGVTNRKICRLCGGANTVCRVGSDNKPVCTCRETYTGDPRAGCEHECEADGDCGDQKACRDFSCIKLCPQSCGETDRCDVKIVNNSHQPSCGKSSKIIRPLETLNDSAAIPPEIPSIG